MSEIKVKCRRFYLMRKEDISGVSGTGMVAEGVEFQNGMCALSFSSAYPHANVYANLRAVREVHGHSGATEVVFVDGETSSPLGVYDQTVDNLEQLFAMTKSASEGYRVRVAVDDLIYCMTDGVWRSKLNNFKVG